jgi:hypothetical protein
MTWIIHGLSLNLSQPFGTIPAFEDGDLALFGN